MINLFEGEQQVLNKPHLLLKHHFEECCAELHLFDEAYVSQHRFGCKADSQALLDLSVGLRVHVSSETRKFEQIHLPGSKPLQITHHCLHEHLAQ